MAGGSAPEWLPRSFLEMIRPFIRRMPGDFASIAAAQFALETGRGEAEGRGGQLWREHGNPWCIKVARDRRFQAGATEDGYATYASFEQAAADRLRILGLYRGWAPGRGLFHGDVMGLVDAFWAPNQQYRQKLTSIIVQEKLYLLDPSASL